MARVLAAAAKEPSVIRWLHATDPDRNVTPELMRSSVRYSTTVGNANQLMPGMPSETASLFIPMYRRGCFVLGQLYGPMSPNALGLALLSGPEKVPVPRSRRFVVDLSGRLAMEFVEYEWLSDGKLCVSLHDIDEHGCYSGQSIVFDGPTIPPSPVPSRVAMRLHYSEVPLDNDRPTVVDAWSQKNTACWENWTQAFSRLRTGNASITCSFSLRAGVGQGLVQGQQTTVVREECLLGQANRQASSTNTLCRMFLQAQGMFLNHPSQDANVLREAERNGFTETVDALYHEEPADEAQAHYYPDALSVYQGAAAAHAEPPTITELAPDEEEEDEGEEDDRAEEEASPQADAALRAEHEHSPNFFEQQVPRPHPHTTYTNAPSIDKDYRQGNQLQPEDASASPVRVTEEPNEYVVVPPSYSVTQTMSAPVPESTTPKPRNPGTAPTPLKDAPSGRGITKSVAKEHVCHCGMRFSHKGHYNAHRRAVHEKIRSHKCSYRDCER